MILRVFVQITDLRGAGRPGKVNGARPARKHRKWTAKAGAAPPSIRWFAARCENAGTTGDRRTGRRPGNSLYNRSTTR